jgi:hypothetical protein
MTEEQIPGFIESITHWYDRAANRYRLAYLWVKIFQLLVTASIPIVSLAMKTEVGGREGLITGTLAAVLLVAEGIQQTLQLQPRWTKYRSTHSALRREMLLFQGAAGPYAQAPSPVKLFTERVDQIVSDENAAWIRDQDRVKDGK